MRKVRSGESLSIPASTWNAFIDATNWVRNEQQNRRSQGVSSGAGVGIVFVKNAESEARERFSALVLVDVAVSPKENEDEFLSSVPVFAGAKMTSERETMPYAILLEPVAPGEIGRAMVLGVVPAQVTIRDADDMFAVPTPGSSAGALQSDSSGVARILWKAGGSGTQWCLLQLGGAGGGSGGDKAYICRVNGGSQTAGYSVTVYPNGRYDAKTESSGTLFLPDLALGSEIPEGTLVLGHKCALKATGGGET